MNDEPPRYHHGDLRAALLAAAEAELAEAGGADFSLRRVAKRVGVSHSAPAHHFGDTDGLLDALATEGFRRFLAAMETREAQAPRDDPRARVIGSGLGYVDFAEAAPALFRLMFATERKPDKSPELIAAGGAAFRHLADGIARLRGVSPFEDASVMVDVMAAWSMVHGFAELMIFRRLPPSAAARDEVLIDLMRRSLP
jgi:AcrR family transcriptional regulator